MWIEEQTNSKNSSSGSVWLHKGLRGFNWEAEHRQIQCQYDRRTLPGHLCNCWSWLTLHQRLQRRSYSCRPLSHNLQPLLSPAVATQSEGQGSTGSQHCVGHWVPSCRNITSLQCWTLKNGQPYCSDMTQLERNTHLLCELYILSELLTYFRPLWCTERESDTD